MPFYLWIILYFIAGLVADSIWLACVWVSHPKEKDNFFPESVDTTKMTHILNVLFWPILVVMMVGAVIVVYAKFFILKLSEFLSWGLRKIIEKEEKKEKEEKPHG